MDMQFVETAGALRVEFTPSVWTTFASHQQLRFWHTERGGVLLASSVGASDGIVKIVQVTGPHRNDRAGRYWLKLDHARVLEEINRAFDEGLHFVGYWHTHPQRSPQLSSQDVVAILPAIQDAGLDLRRILMVVVGGDRDAVALDVCAVDCVHGTWERLLPTRFASEPTSTRAAAGR